MLGHTAGCKLQTHAFCLCLPKAPMARHAHGLLEPPPKMRRAPQRIQSSELAGCTCQGGECSSQNIPHRTQIGRPAGVDVSDFAWPAPTPSRHAAFLGQAKEGGKHIPRVHFPSKMPTLDDSAKTKTKFLEVTTMNDIDTCGMLQLHASQVHTQSCICRDPVTEVDCLQHPRELPCPTAAFIFSACFVTQTRLPPFSSGCLSRRQRV